MAWKTEAVTKWALILWAVVEMDCSVRCSVHRFMLHLLTEQNDGNVTPLTELQSWGVIIVSFSHLHNIAVIFNRPRGNIAQF